MRLPISDAHDAMLSALQVSRRNSWNQLLGIDWLPSSLYVSRYKYKLEA